ncbi:MAG: SRPBCC family protein [Sphaerobacter sp.]|nr:SRPBCC family protein [Sphaerobacter sp.]
MHTATEVVVQAEAIAVYRLAAAVERWPQILPHYRWVRVLRDDGHARLVEMAARRDVIPVRWRAVQVCDPTLPRITFQHVGGVTTGMDVAWLFEPGPDGLTVRIVHRFDPPWPLIGGLVADHIIGPHFVDYIAGQTLRQIKLLAEAQSGGWE